MVRQIHCFDPDDKRAVAMQPQKIQEEMKAEFSSGAVHDSASGTSEASDSGTSETSYTTLCGDGHASSEVRVTAIPTEIIILATRTREASSEKGQRIREDTLVVDSQQRESRPQRAQTARIRRRSATQAPTEHAQQADGSVEPSSLHTVVIVTRHGVARYSVLEETAPSKTT